MDALDANTLSEDEEIEAREADSQVENVFGTYLASRADEEADSSDGTEAAQLSEEEMLAEIMRQIEQIKGEKGDKA
ncbi:hypothetical protein [Alloscardovia omnicolens]|uniref:hypothetical protein n=1 Tax=Alloscardovia omnicolens TaxID=419015 RepID=UPI0006659683|nr:hypothetical protein [Alloscardovia omnicolens]KWZ75514.1 hypothetical protein HMPREF3214_00378 [Alloscardovia omnicolens]MDK6327934.1 hypothetical protein [Alloscardovia omnicolens]MDK8073822.1 hypothetical protein [Alloscardovia omnicolens]MDK8081794.1 hypothetical protein [Alloscardovia omnicolens]